MALLLSFVNEIKQNKNKIFFSLSLDAICSIMTNLSDKIISVFLDKQTVNLKDSDISHSLVAQGTQIYTEEVRCYVQALSPALFQLSFNKDSSMIIRVDPQVINPTFAFLCFLFSIEFRLTFVDHFSQVVVIIQ